MCVYLCFLSLCVFVYQCVYASVCMCICMCACVRERVCVFKCMDGCAYANLYHVKNKKNLKCGYICVI